MPVSVAKPLRPFTLDDFIVAKFDWEENFHPIDGITLSRGPFQVYLNFQADPNENGLYIATPIRA